MDELLQLLAQLAGYATLYPVFTGFIFAGTVFVIAAAVTILLVGEGNPQHIRISPDEWPESPEDFQAPSDPEVWDEVEPDAEMDEAAEGWIKSTPVY